MTRWAAAVIVLGIVTEALVAPRLEGLDAAVGIGLVALGVVCGRARGGAAGALLVVAGGAWFVGSWATAAAYWHRGPLVHVLFTQPAGRIWPARTLQRGAVVAAYAYAIAAPLADTDVVNLAWVCFVPAVAVVWVVMGPRRERRARLTLLGSACLFAGAVGFGALARAHTVSADTVLAVYDVAVLVMGAGVASTVLAGRAEAAVVGLVVDLGEVSGRGALRDRLAETVGDPSLDLGFWVPALERYVDELGRPLDVGGLDGRELTAIDDGGSQVAVLLHDPGILDDPHLRAGVGSATRLAVANARLQAEIADRAAAIEASQQRIVHAADEQGRRLELELRQGPLRRLQRVAALASGVDGDLRVQADAAQTELRELAHGIRPSLLTERGLAAALGDLAGGAAVPVELEVTPARFAPVAEATAYFVCAEALTNVAKHARASHATVRIAPDRGQLVMTVVDDGVGGAALRPGSGLRGLGDRVAALGGRLTVEDAAAGGTVLAASIPISPSAATAGSPTRPCSH
jgi:signal transduction histidine kinase